MVPLKPLFVSRRSAFTFVELLIASTMIAVLFVGLGAHLRGGLTVWQRTTAMGEALQRQRVASDRLERDLANALVFDARKDAYGGTTGQLPLPVFGDTTLSFFTVSPMGASGSPAIRFVTYACGEHGGTTGLWRTSQSVGAARARSPEPMPELLLPDCDALAFQYAYLPAPEAGQPGRQPLRELEWKSAWPDDADEPLRLPRLVEVSIEVAGRQARRVCALPSGAFGQSEPPPPL